MRLRTVVVLGILAGGSALLSRRIALREDLDWRTVEKPGDILDINNYGVHYIDQGHGDVMLMLHGFGGSTFSFRHLAAAFSRDHRVIAVDLKGFGYTERDSSTGLSAMEQVAMLKEFLDRCGVRHATIIGHSMGSGVAARFATAYPERVRALVLAAPALESARPGPRFAHAPAWLMRPLLPFMAGIASRRLLNLMYVDTSKITPEVRDGYLRPTRLRGSMDGLLKMIHDRAFDPPIDFSRLTLPTLILCGARDVVVPLSAAQRAHDRTPHSRMVVIDGAAHGLLEERPDDAARAIREFLAAADTGPRPSGQSLASSG